MIAALRSISAVILGFIAGFLVFVAAWYASLRIFPLPPGAEFLDAGSLDAARASRPTGATIIILAGLVLGTFIASFVATKFAEDMKSLYGLILGLVFLAEGIVKMREIPHPVWFWIVGVPLLVIAPLLGTSAALPRRETSAAK